MSENDKDQQIAELTKLLARYEQDFARYDAAKFISEHSPDGKIVAVMENGLISPVPVYREPYVQELIAAAILNDRKRIAGVLAESHESFFPVEIAIAELQEIAANIWWVTTVSDGERLDAALAELSKELNTAFDDFTTAIEAMSERHKQLPIVRETAITATNTVKELKHGIRRALAGTDNGEYIRQLGKPELIELARKIQGVIRRRTPDEGRAWVADQCMTRKADNGKDYLENALIMFRELNAKQPADLDEWEEIGLNALRELQKKNHDKKGTMLRKWIERRRKQIKREMIIRRDI